MTIKPIQFFINYNHHKDLYIVTIIDNDMPLWADTFAGKRELDLGIELLKADFENDRGIQIIAQEL